MKTAYRFDGPAKGRVVLLSNSLMSNYDMWDWTVPGCRTATVCFATTRVAMAGLRPRLDPIPSKCSVTTRRRCWMRSTSTRRTLSAFPWAA